MFDYKDTLKKLDLLFKEAAYLKDWYADQVERYIYVGEYALALDGIAYAYLHNSVPMPNDLFAIFEELANAMELDRDPEYDSVAKLRAAQGAAPGAA